MFRNSKVKEATVSKDVRNVTFKYFEELIKDEASPTKSVALLCMEDLSQKGFDVSSLTWNKVKYIVWNKVKNNRNLKNPK